MISEKGSTIAATLGTVCWCVQLIPQIIFLYRKKDCTGFPPIFMFLWVICGIPFACYTLISHANIVIEIQPHLFMFFCSISYAQSLYYPPYGQRSIKKVLLHLIPIFLIDIAFECGFVIWLRPMYAKGVTAPGIVFGTVASVLLAAGLVPPYWELAKRNGEVVGISFIFLGVDSLGAYLSILSVILGNMDIMGIVLYSIVAALELGIFLSHFIWCCRFKWFGNKEKLLDQEKDAERYSGAEGDNESLSTATNGEPLVIGKTESDNYGTQSLVDGTRNERTRSNSFLKDNSVSVQVQEETRSSRADV
ncbi:hypothetical protein ACO0QE_002823 [Hanseniaspora vineae]